jgi:hypothetical protein
VWSAARGERSKKENTQRISENTYTEKISIKRVKVSTLTIPKGIHISGVKRLISLSIPERTSGNPKLVKRLFL